MMFLVIFDSGICLKRDKSPVLADPAYVLFFTDYHLLYILYRFDPDASLE